MFLTVCISSMINVAFKFECGDQRTQKLNICYFKTWFCDFFFMIQIFLNNYRKFFFWFIFFSFIFCWRASKFFSGRKVFKEFRNIHENGLTQTLGIPSTKWSDHMRLFFPNLISFALYPLFLEQFLLNW